MSPENHLFKIVVAVLAINSVALVLRLWIRMAIPRSFGSDEAGLCLSFVSPTYLYTKRKKTYHRRI
ncbi:hypothetical protein F4775DRAFT_555565 [Biscogniauxia sp. FL1348]|nr:hypothetical protein F4775DRAFT_555565 [Biscogniauxia sp. FL1348]